MATSSVSKEMCSEKSRSDPCEPGRARAGAEDRPARSRDHVPHLTTNTSPLKLS
jgi:hypothetical protein